MIFPATWTLDNLNHKLQLIWELFKYDYKKDVLSKYIFLHKTNIKNYYKLITNNLKIETLFGSLCCTYFDIAHTFHKLCDRIKYCDRKGKTITVIKNTKGSIFGGFTSVPWDSKIGFVEDSTALLFNLNNMYDSRKKLFVSDRGRYIYSDSYQEPIFMINFYDQVVMIIYVSPVIVIKIELDIGKWNAGK